MLINKKIGLIGAGAMAEAILAGLVEQQMVPSEQIFIANRQNEARLKFLTDRYQLELAHCHMNEVIRADVVILAVKPKDVFTVLKNWGKKLKPGQIIISVAAGIQRAYIEKFVQSGVSVIRAMPNTSATVGCSATAIAVDDEVNEEQLAMTKQIFSTVGEVLLLDESLMDAVTGLSGTGPAYIYFLVEALQSAGEKVGLSQADAKKLTLQTLLGATQMLLETKEDPKDLRQAVTSPGGTTMAGLSVLRAYHFTEAIEQAVRKATERSQEMGEEFATKRLNV